MKKQIGIAVMTLALALAPASASWAQTSGTDSSVSGSSKMGTGSAGKTGPHGMSNHPGGSAAKSQKMHNNNNGQ
jgi:hypothetical protein